ncbi:MAG TPA: patatin-like phospholipase family protein [Enhygromyxa sp.]|nr:patatin-like phospholipase family protein [Enhygromyxa sp.]
MSARFSVVLSGGGCKAFWSVGALDVLEQHMPTVDHWSGVSAGAAMAISRVAGRFEHSFSRFLESVAVNRRNFYPARALRRERPFPHDSIYRDAVGHLLGADGFANVRAGAPIHILLSYVEPGQPFVPTTFAAVQAFIDRRRRHVLHGPEQLPAGIGTEVVCSREAADVEQLIDWTLMSSTIPPITPIRRKAGRRYLDGGLIDNVPIRALPAEARAAGSKILCLISHRVPVPRAVVRTAEGAEVLYLSALDDLPVRVWDYTSPERVHAAIELGRRNATTLLDRVARFVAAEPASRQTG